MPPSTDQRQHQPIASLNHTHSDPGAILQMRHASASSIAADDQTTSQRKLSLGQAKAAATQSPSNDTTIHHASPGSNRNGKQGSDEEHNREPPPWSELKTKAGKERKRLPLACVSCRRKKIRCSGEKPACKHCTRSRTPCVYKVTTRKATPRTDYMTMLDKRLKRMEERVIKIMPDQEPKKMASIGRAVVKPLAMSPTKPTGPKKRTAGDAFQSEIADWAAEPDIGLRRRSDAVGMDEKPSMMKGADHLPSMELQKHLAEVYFDNLYGQAYHLLHKPSYMRKLQ